MIQLIIKYLKKVNHFTKLENFENSFYSHPNYPSLLAITDSLTQIEIENIAANVPFTHIDQLPNNFIAFLRIEKQDYYLLTKVNHQFLIENEKKTKKILKKEELEGYWTDLVLVVEENDEKQHSFFTEKSTLIVPFLLLFLSSITLFFNHLNISQILFLVLNGIGIFISIEILKTYFKQGQQKESKFCSLNESFSCNSIIQTKNYVFSKYVEFVDLPIVFFSIFFFSQILDFHTLFIAGILSLLSIPFLTYSIYLQKFVLKKWCLLCLLIAFLMVGLGVLFVFNYAFLTFQKQDIFTILLLTITFSIAWFYIKKQLLEAKNNNQKLQNLLRFKRKEEIFTKIANPIVHKDNFETLEKIVIGNVNAKNTITLFLSPSCPHCHTAYKNAISLVEKYEEQLNLSVCFNVNINNANNPNLIVYKTILSLYNSQNKEYMLALEDWHIKKQSLDDWKKNWFFENDFTKENNQIEKQYQWCLDANLNHTPIKIFNGFIIPDIYELNEIVYFFKE